MPLFGRGKPAESAEKSGLAPEISAIQRETKNKAGKIIEVVKDWWNKKFKKKVENITDKIKDKIKEMEEKKKEEKKPNQKKEEEEKTPEQKEKERKEEEEHLKEELKEHLDKAKNESKDMGVPPNEQDEYDPPPMHEDEQDQQPQPQQQDESGDGSPQESGDKEKPTVFFEITPSGSSKTVIIGKYTNSRKSYYDKATKTWSSRKQLTEYNASISGNVRQKISGKLGKNGRIALPVPANYALDTASLKSDGPKPKFYRDQNGCFYVESHGACNYSIDFLKEVPPFTSQPVPEDSELTYSGKFSKRTEDFLKTVSGSHEQKAMQIQAYIHSNYSYPGDGVDLTAAYALQSKLRHGSSGDQYVQNLDTSEYLECYSAHNLFIALARKLGVPSRLAIGHQISTAKGGKAEITSATGHAWGEIWNGNEWKVIDATPAPKDDTKKKEHEKEEQDNTPTEDPNQKDELDSEKEAQKQEQGKKKELEQKIQDSESGKDLQEAQKAVKDSDLSNEAKKDLEKKVQEKLEEMKQELKDKLEQMTEDGFMDEAQRDKLQKEIDQADIKDIDKLKDKIEEGNPLYEEYELIKEDVSDLVEEWYDYFLKNLPREEEMDIDDSSLGKAGRFDRKAIRRPVNTIMGRIKNPRIFRPEVKPKFIASIMVDVSGSMEGDKLKNAQKLLVFYCELFSRLEKEFGYIRFSINLFSDGITEVKAFDHEYDSSERYQYQGGQKATVKYRLMTSVKTQGGTSMLEAVQKGANDLEKEKENYDDYLSAMYFIGDGGDSYGRTKEIRDFLELSREEGGFGEHMRSAILLGSPHEKAILSSIFGEDNTAVAADLGELIEEAMIQFETNVDEYYDGLK